VGVTGFCGLSALKWAWQIFFLDQWIGIDENNTYQQTNTFQLKFFNDDTNTFQLKFFFFDQSIGIDDKFFWINR